MSFDIEYSRGIQSPNLEDDSDSAVQHLIRGGDRKLRIAYCIAGVLGILCLVLIIILAVGSSGSGSGGSIPTPSPQSSLPEAYTEFLRSVEATRDFSIDPCSDFYQHACGGWLSKAVIPSDKLSIGRSFSEIDERNLNTEMEIAGEDWPIIGEFYQSCMNLDAIEAAGISPIRPFIQPWIDLSSKSKNMTSFAELHGSQSTLLGASFLFDVGISVDALDPSRYVIYISQGGLSMSSKDYYLDVNTTNEFTLHVQKMFEMYEASLQTHSTPHDISFTQSISPLPASQRAQAVAAFESSLARFQKSPAEMRDVWAIYNGRTLHELQGDYPNIDWDRFLFAMGVPSNYSHRPRLPPSTSSVTSSSSSSVLSSTNLQFKSLPTGGAPFVIDNPDFFSSLNSLLSNQSSTLVLSDGTSIDVWSALLAYGQYRTLRSRASALPKRFAAESFAFYQTFLLGQTQEAPRNKTCTRRTDAYLGDIIGRIFVERRFPGNSKTIVLSMIDSIKKSFAAQLQSLSWLDSDTRQAALQKLSAISDLIGYPAKWDTYRGLNVISTNAYFSNLIALEMYGSNKALAQLGQPVDKTKFQMTPATVNAYYDPTMNSINFPAGILQPIFFNASFPAAANFGGIGMVIGHELTHGFDDQGSQFDGAGRMKNWWSPAVQQRFQDRSSCFERQYSAFTVNGEHINGNLTLGENIADNGGLATAYHAFQTYSSLHPEPSWSSVSPLSPVQLFFISFAQSWCSLRRPGLEHELLLSDPHSPPKYRVNGPLSNLPQFAQAFQCAAGSPMNPANKCLLWSE